MKPGQRVIVALRRMIATGELKGGERIAEIPTAEALGVSRMPVRTALRALEHEGLVVRLGARGYAARSFSRAQVEGAIEVRGVLEGLAARQACQRTLESGAVAAFEACLQAGDEIFASGRLDPTEIERYQLYNSRFHHLVLEASCNPAIGVALARNDHEPMASSGALAVDWTDLDAEFEHLQTAHLEHHAVYRAIRAADADAAEQIMRKHARAALGDGSRLERHGVERGLRL